MKHMEKQIKTWAEIKRDLHIFIKLKQEIYHLTDDKLWQSDKFTDDLDQFLHSKFKELWGSTNKEWAHKTERLEEDTERDRLCNLMNENMEVGYNEKVRDLRSLEAEFWGEGA